MKTYITQFFVGKYDNYYETESQRPYEFKANRLNQVRRF